MERGRTRSQLWYLPLLASATALMMVRIIVMARLLDVGGFGIYSAGLLVSSTFCMLACLGLQPLLQRDMPVMAARGRLLRPLVLAVQAAMVACACAAIAMLLPLARVPVTGLAGLALAVGLVHGLSQQVFVVATVESRSLSQTVRYSLQNLVRAGLITLASAAVALLTRKPVLVLAVEAAISLVLTGAIYQRIAESHGVRLERLVALAWRKIPKIDWHTALVFLAVSLVASAVQFADRWFSASMLPPQQFAQYAFATIAILIAQSAQVMINASLYPALSRRYALEGEAVAFAAASRASLSLLGVAAVLCVPAWFIAEFAVSRLYAGYAPALAILPVILAVSCLRVSDFWSSFLVICGYERQLLVTHFTAGVGVCALWFAHVATRGGGVSIHDFAWLALWLAAATYAGTAGVAWRKPR